MVITIVGVGLIGGSMALDLKKSGFADAIIGVDRSEEHLEKALTLGIIDKKAELKAAVTNSDLIVLAIPVNGIVQCLPKIMDMIEHQLVTEVGSTKKPILDTIRLHPKRNQFLSTHPMAGTEFSGPQAAVYGLFRNKCNVIIDTHLSSHKTKKTIEGLYQDLGMFNVEYGAEEHDLHTAYVSHISHISSFALALTVLAKEQNENKIFQLASGGFGSTVRLAKSSPEMWVPVFEQNRDNVLDVLDEHINQLARFRSLLIKKDYETFYKLIREANEIKRILNTNNKINTNGNAV